MAREKKPVHKVQMTEGKRNMIHQILEEYDIQDALKDLLGGTIHTAFPKTEYQRCIVHQVRNTLKYVSDKDRKAFATDLKTIYHASNEQKAYAALERVNEKWIPKYPNSMKRWYDNWDAITPIFKFSSEVQQILLKA